MTYNVIEQRSEYLPRTAFETKRPTTPPVQQATYKEGARDDLSKKRSEEKLRLNQAIIQTRSSWLNCALRDDGAVFWVSIGHYGVVAVGN